MDDIDTRLEAERPEVAGVLRSMNWEERLERARASRKAVLTRNEAAEKRPVVRIIDANAVARKKAEVVKPPVPAEEAVTADGGTVIPLPLNAPAAERPSAPVPRADAPADRDRPSMAGRTALGFGLGLGLGTSILVGAYVLFARPQAPAAPETSSATAAVVAQRVDPAPQPAASAPRPVASAPVPPAVGPTVPDTAPDGIATPSVPEGAAPDLPTALLALQLRPQPAAPSAFGPDFSVRPTGPLPAPGVAALDAALPRLPAAATDAVIRPSNEAAVARPAPARPAARAPDPELAPVRGPDPARPETGLPALALAETSSAPIDLLLPLGIQSVIPVAFPGPPGAAPAPEEPPAVALAPPARPTPPVASADPGIPDAASLFVRLAIPQTVSDAEAEEIAGLIRDIGVGDSRVSRVGFKVSETHVRYYHSDDAPAAEALAELVGTEARDHTSFRPRPPDGMVEIFLAGDRTEPPPRAAAAPKRARPQPPDELTRMRDRIVNRLRRGEHL